MRVFISWSGERSRAVAAAIADLLPDVLQDVETWMSAHDISAGSRWGADLGRELEGSNFGVLCLTPENLASPWLLFEAGSLAKSVSSSRVVPYRLDLRPTDVEFPLAQFQGVDADRDGTLKLVASLNEAGQEPLSEERLRRLFDRWWPDMEARLSKVPEREGSATHQRDDRALLEEILQLARKGRAFPDPNQWTDDRVPKNAVWKTVHDVNESDLKRMTSGALRKYREALSKRYSATASRGEEEALLGKMMTVDRELESRGEGRDERGGATGQPAPSGPTTASNRRRFSAAARILREWVLSPAATHHRSPFPRSMGGWSGAPTIYTSPGLHLRPGTALSLAGQARQGGGKVENHGKNNEGLTLKDLYSEIGQNYRFSLAWKERLFAGYFGVLAGLALVAKWLEEKENLPAQKYALVALAGAILSFLFSRLSVRVSESNWKCIRAGKRLEDRAGTTGVFTLLDGPPEEKFGEWPKFLPIKFWFKHLRKVLMLKCLKWARKTTQHWFLVQGFFLLSSVIFALISSLVGENDWWWTSLAIPGVQALFLCFDNSLFKETKK